MTGKTHQVLGITSGLGYYLVATDPSYGPATLGAVLVTSYFSALLPDIDQPVAKIWDSIPYGKTIGQMADPFIKHRNVSHSLLGMGIFGLGAYYLISSFPDYWGINQYVLIVVCMIAYGSHLVADLLTVEGVPLFFPYPRLVGLPPKPFEGARILTGKWFENLVIFPLVNLALIAIVISEWEKIKSIIFK